MRVDCLQSLAVLLFPEIFPKFPAPQECFREFYNACFVLLQSECAWKMADTMKSFLCTLLKCLEMDHIFQRGLHSHVAPTRESHEPGKSDLRKLNVNKVLRISHRLFQGLFLLLPKSITFFCAVCFLASSFLWRLLRSLGQSGFAVFLCWAVSALHPWWACISFLLLSPAVSLLCRLHQQAS